MNHPFDRHAHTQIDLKSGSEQSIIVEEYAEDVIGPSGGESGLGLGRGW